jgi:hypothetical protein
VSAIHFQAVYLVVEIDQVIDVIDSLSGVDSFEINLVNLVMETASDYFNGRFEEGLSKTICFIRIFQT